ncbi:MAG: rhomboid family intramembrane serine protease [Chitinophagaceae bacterium]|nr:rhomboid family intramembrane serine protease [Chitinophagaceae bacterium]
MTEFRPSRFQILPTVVKNLLIINGLVFLAQVTIGNQASLNLDNMFALHTWQSPLFKPWQFVTHMFMHGSFEHILSNMFAMWMFGSILENVWGPKRFLIFYMVCGLGAALCHMTVLFYEMQPIAATFKQLPFEQQQELINNPLFKLNQATLGASGAVFGCLAAFGYLFPNRYIYLYFFLPLKAKWFVLLYAAFELYAGVRNSAGDDVAHYAHLGGALVGIILVYFWNKTNKKTFY